MKEVRGRGGGGGGRWGEAKGSIQLLTYKFLFILIEPSYKMGKAESRS
jgi:hypothetical protein